MHAHSRDLAPLGCVAMLDPPVFECLATLAEVAGGDVGRGEECGARRKVAG
ncbi:hypothetical protein FPZ12_035410 [Amycolatopsis acidicola]|uniref:Uncharacterized protein n=1 Tax=Amycolatopsis acidicola TaxID=2596893 RepID=A0A5N0UPT3_9PSEU|nr:hypothetical protein FPZ12_035410 [Amycolatopsis acidicola]